MAKNSPVAIFLAASTALAASSILTKPINAGENHKSSGGLKEWTTDQPINAESTLDEDAKKAEKKAKEQNICIPIGEGENCW